MKNGRRTRDTIIPDRVNAIKLKEKENSTVKYIIDELIFSNNFIPKKKDNKMNSQLKDWLLMNNIAAHVLTNIEKDNKQS